MGVTFFWLRQLLNPHGASAATRFIVLFDLLDKRPLQAMFSQSEGWMDTVCF